MADVVRMRNTSGRPPADEPDAHGQAALMLVESILHALVETGTFSAEKALAIVETAQDVKEEVGKDTRESSTKIARSLDLLGQIAVSFNTDVQ